MKQRTLTGIVLALMAAVLLGCFHLPYFPQLTAIVVGCGAVWEILGVNGIENKGSRISGCPGLRSLFYFLSGSAVPHAEPQAEAGALGSAVPQAVPENAATFFNVSLMFVPSCITRISPVITVYHEISARTSTHFQVT